MSGPRSGAMQRGKKVRILGLMVMLHLFVFVVLEVLWGGGREKRRQPKVVVPSGRFWRAFVPSAAYWNREQQKLDLLHNPILKAENVSAIDWFNATTGRGSCEPDVGVRAQPRACEKKPFLLLAIKSLAPHFDRRQAIRQTWGRAGRLANRTVATVFLLGDAARSDHFPDLRDLLRRESSAHRDLLIWDYRDTFFNLTVKEVLFLDWLERRCRDASFVFKGDDDVFVNTRRVLDFLEGLSPARAESLFVGDVITNAGPHRDRKVKYFVPESVFVGQYPPYAGGGGYLYSGELALRLRSVSPEVPLYPIDDVYTGMCLRKLGLAPERHKGFRTFGIQEKYRDNACVYHSLMLVHRRTPQQIIEIWSWISNPTLKCK
ncbi:N-acetyllactosaminide beta-1,3-N-acetylglucosaminyltransferase 2-like [Scleropages formosus]|uniref:Hexosyltransferase n=1 Tax=Scleropages formosus TaxID=113540 RepID=A0A0P7UFG9_SCLFO|nr:N-acetyllactosaminide beta-1,3-N-acetylglucosaminyltransferase 2-like [Scleropages formosus]